ncbi:TIGR00725 family protein [Halosimplex halophilum]|uniref:TIGR00725 family protein n=1 Tax=Halosimplex halophilum TaxID=2559572 RepID=UPI00107F7B3D|nr:TIGR00725 family protein [Halosimplex halophilum]
MRVSVIGGGRVSDEEAATAERVGRELADRGHEVVCGGLGGVMAAACRGASEAGGHTIGILPTERRADASDYVDTPIATGMGNARNVLVVMNGDAVVAVDGGTGTLSELGHALDLGKPVAGIGTHGVDGVEGIDHVETPAEAVDSVERRV